MDILLRASSVRQGQVQGVAASSADTEGAVLSFRVCGPSIPCRCRYPQGSSLTVSRNGNLLEMVMNCSSVTFIMEKAAGDTFVHRVQLQFPGSHEYADARPRQTHCGSIFRRL